jgi:hypothetical protein
MNLREGLSPHCATRLLVASAAALAVALVGTTSEAQSTVPSDDGATPMQLDGYETVPADAPPVGASATRQEATRASTVPTTAADGPEPSNDPEPEWTPRFHWSLGLAAGGIGLIDPFYQFDHLVGYSLNFSGRSPPFVLSPSTGIGYTVSRVVGLAARLDVFVAPNTVPFRSSSAAAVGWLIAPVMTLGLRLQVIGPVHFGFGGRFGVAAVGVSKATLTGVLYGGELSVGASFGPDSRWSASIRAAFDNLGLWVTLALDWNVI